MQDELIKRWAEYLRGQSLQTRIAPVPSLPEAIGQDTLAEKRPALRNLLFMIFDDDELRRFIGDLNDPELRACVPGSAASFVAVVDSLEGALERRNQADSDFFAALVQLRPRFASQIRDVVRIWDA